MNPVKLILTSRKNLEFKYGKNFSRITALLTRMEKADKARKIDTKTIFIDDAQSMKPSAVKPAKFVDMKECKRVVDELFKKFTPAYIVILGAQDVFPFQEIDNPADDDDLNVPSDLPYACDTPYNKSINAFTGPTRVVGRIPDVPGKQSNADYLKVVLENSINHTPINCDQYMKYFAVSAQVWKKSTELSLRSMFGESTKMLISPVTNEATSKYTAAQLKPQTHFYNCHGVLNDPRYFGQKGNNYPVALHADMLDQKVTAGTIVAAECCYGAELFDPTSLQPQSLSIANKYFLNNAIAFLGSSTIAYGPADSQGLADLITQYFIKSVIGGASTGRALLEARQRFLSVSGPQLDPYELKTLAQFYLLGDPSISPGTSVAVKNADALSKNTVENNRINLFNKGVNLRKTTFISKKQNTAGKTIDKGKLNEILKDTKFTNADKENVYLVTSRSKVSTPYQKKLTGENAKFRTFIKPGKGNSITDIKVLVVKENEEQILGWRLYESR